jgi:nucleotide-binding universal stress UspA family protein
VRANDRRTDAVLARERDAPARAAPAMFRRILVPVDFTRKTLSAVRAAGRLAQSFAAEVTLLHVIERIDDDTSVLKKFYRQLEENARNKMRPLVDALVGKKVQVRSEILYGNRVAEILRFAEDSRTDLIVMSSHKLPLRRPTVESWGTISYKVGILSRCPVLLVK